MRDSLIETTIPPFAVAQGRPAVLGARHMVSSSHYLATLASLRGPSTRMRTSLVS